MQKDKAAPHKVAQKKSVNSKRGQKSKCAYIFGGVNGAGKTTLYYEMLEKSLEKGSDFGCRINVDELVSSFGDYKNSKDQIRAAKIALKMRQTCIQKGLDFNQESTLSGASAMKLFKTLKQKAYRICLYYVRVESVQMAKERIKMRVAKGGHFVSDELVERRFESSWSNFEKLMCFCDEIYLYDNSGKEFKRLKHWQSYERNLRYLS